MTDPTAHWSPSEVDDDGDRASYPPPPALDLDAIEARANAASSGPWAVDPCQGEAAVIAGGPVSLVVPWRRDRHALADCVFIAHARQDVPDLVARVRELEAQLSATEAEARTALDALHARCDAAEGDAAAAETLAARLGDLLRATADALKGPPPPLGLHSTHDLPTVAAEMRARLAAVHSVTSSPTDDELSDESALWIVTAPHSAGYAVRVLNAEDARQYRDTARGVHVWHLWDEATGCPAPRPVPCTCGSGGHPRECKRHPEAFAAHVAELSAEADADRDHCPTCGALDLDHTCHASAGERFAAEHPYAAGAMHGGIAHRSEVSK